ncbi:MAG: hypothetical protein AABX62_03155 [Thermoproteota archaeon]
MRPAPTTTPASASSDEVSMSRITALAAMKGLEELQWLKGFGFDPAKNIFYSESGLFAVRS